VGGAIQQSCCRLLLLTFRTPQGKMASCGPDFWSVDHTRCMCVCTPFPIPWQRRPPPGYQRRMSQRRASWAVAGLLQTCHKESPRRGRPTFATVVLMLCRRAPPVPGGGQGRVVCSCVCACMCVRVCVFACAFERERARARARASVCACVCHV
jgi:hypothetical protein